MKHLLQNMKRNIFVATAGIILAGTVAIALTIHNSEPEPLSDEELVRVHTEIQKVASVDIGHLELNRDGSVTAFVTSGHYDKRTVVARKAGDKWTASVTMEYF